MSRARDRFLAELAAELAALRAIGRGRSLRQFAGTDFSTNDYLGLARAAAADPPLPLCGSTGSRLLSGEHALWAECEAALADWHGGTRAALCFTSGFAANQGLLATLLRPGDHVLSDAHNHGSIVDGLRLAKATRHVFRHQDLAELEASLTALPAGGRRFVVTESLFGMDGDRTDLRRVARLCAAHDALLIVDEAHATGCFGPAGSGLVDALGLRDAVFATVHTCGKALGAHGAYVVADAIVRDYLVQGCRQLIFTTALPPAVAAVLLRAVQRARDGAALRERLAANARHLRSRLAGSFELSGGEDHILPIVLGADAHAQRWADALLARGLRVPAIRPPAVPEGTARLRVSVCAWHTRDELDALADALSGLARTAR